MWCTLDHLNAVCHIHCHRQNVTSHTIIISGNFPSFGFFHSSLFHENADDIQLILSFSFLSPFSCLSSQGSPLKLLSVIFSASSCLQSNQCVVQSISRGHQLIVPANLAPTPSTTNYGPQRYQHSWLFASSWMKLNALLVSFLQAFSMSKSDADGLLNCKCFPGL